MITSTQDSSEKRKEDRDDGWTLCNKCESYRPPRAHHCRYSNNNNNINVSLIFSIFFQNLQALHSKNGSPLSMARNR